MEEYLKQLFQKDGVMIFHTDYHLLRKLLGHFSEEKQRDDAYCIHAILGGNAFYETVVNCLKEPNPKVDRAVYNVFVDQVYSGDRFWKKEICDPGHFEYLLRIMFAAAALDLSDIPERTIISDTETGISAEMQEDLESAEAAYKAQEYRTAFEKADRLFAHGVKEAAGLLGVTYYTGKGTKKNYNEAMRYFSYPHRKSSERDREEREIMERLLEMRDKTANSVPLCLTGTLLVIFFMLISGFYVTHAVFATVNTVILITGGAILAAVYRRRYIFDFSWYFFVLGCMLLCTVVL